MRPCSPFVPPLDCIGANLRSLTTNRLTSSTALSVSLNLSMRPAVRELTHPLTHSVRALSPVTVDATRLGSMFAGL